MLLYHTCAYSQLGQAIGQLLGADLGQIERQIFPDGERYLRVLDAVEGQEVVLVGGTINDADTLEIFDLGCALVRYGARRLRLMIPYFGYSTMERSLRSGEVVTAKTRARLLSAIPLAPDGNHIFLVDLHAEGIPHYFEGGVRPRHIYAKEVVCDLILRCGGPEPVLACTDAGRAKWVQSLANELGLTASFVFKRRIDGSRTEVAAVSAQVAGRRVVIYDDMIRSGSSLIGAARAYREAGAATIAAVTTHGVLPGEALDRLHESGLFEHIACTDSHPRALALAGPRLEVATIAPLLARALGGNQ